MKREEKNKQSREKILDAAVTEFGTKGYDGASLNCAVNSSGISKGLVYHYFTNKDELYLACVKRCFDTLVGLLVIARCEDSQDFAQTAKKYFEVRNNFFMQNPDLCRIFFEATMQPPLHLKDTIAGLKKEFVTINLHLIHSGFDKLQLRDGVSIQDAIDYYLIATEAFNYTFYKHFDKITKTESHIKQHELKLQKMLDMILFGIVKFFAQKNDQSDFEEEIK